MTCFLLSQFIWWYYLEMNLYHDLPVHEKEGASEKGEKMRNCTVGSTGYSSNCIPSTNPGFGDFCLFCFFIFLKWENFGV